MNEYEKENQIEIHDQALEDDHIAASVAGAGDVFCEHCGKYIGQYWKLSPDDCIEVMLDNEDKIWLCWDCFYKLEDKIQAEMDSQKEEE